MTICQSLVQKLETQGNKTAVRSVIDGKWMPLTWREYIEAVEEIAAGILELGVKPGDRIAIMSNTRVEWALIDIAALGIGAIVVPVYASNILDDMKYILNDSAAKILFLENVSLFQKWKSIERECGNVKNIISIEEVGGVMSLSDLKKKGQSYRKAKPDFYKKSIETLSLQNVASIVYTSGTTGSPKGVMISHENIMSEIGEVFPHIGVNSTDSSLTFLPYAHILGRVEHWGHIYCGFTMNYAENIDKIRINLIETHPTFMVAVPRIFEKIYNSMISQAEASPIKKKIFDWAIAVGKEISHAKIQKTTLPMSTLLKYQLAKKLVFDKLSQKLGGKLRFSFSGGAPLSRDIAEFFHAANLLIVEGYGLTETTAGVLANSPFSYKFGTVGTPIGETQIRLASDGELLVKSKKNMMGYYNNDSATAEVMNDSWFATGDIAEIDSEGFVKITDRKKDLIKTAGGKFVAPQKLENYLKLSKYISNVLIHGDQRKYVVALLTVNYENIIALAKEKNISFSKKEELVKNPEVLAAIREVVADVNSRLGSWESIKNFDILAEDFTIEKGELTPSLKVKRKYCDKKYRELLDRLYD